MARDRIPSSRVGRTARIGGLAAGQAVRQAGTRAANLTRSPDAAGAALEARQLEAARQIVAVLGTMKGAAMKVGQVLSFLDVGLVSEANREEFQRLLAQLRDAAPRVRFADMRKVLEEDLEEPLGDVFETIDEEPIAAASIGQVYRATLPGGRPVAVKVQYPGVAGAVRADMQNLGLILRLMKRTAPGLDARAIGDEVRERIGEELDYELEAQNQRTMARLYRGHPFILVPEVVTSLSRERVIVSELVEGAGFDELRELPQLERDRVGEIVFRFFFGSMYRHHEFSTDPHPGNFLLLDDGRMAFLDFGMYKRMDPRLIDFELRFLRAGIEGDAEELKRLWVANGTLTEPDRIAPEEVLDQFRAATWWYTADEEVPLRRELATEMIIDASDPRSRYFDQMRYQRLPPDHLFGRRVEFLTLAVLAQLGARANWHRIAREWIYGDPPQTELGRLEAPFHSCAAA